MKRILYVVPTTGIGGVEAFLKDIHRCRDMANYKNTFLLFSSGPLYKELVDLGAEVHLLPHTPRLSKMSDRQMVSDEIKKLINKNNIDLVHSAMAYGAIFSARICKKMKVPHVWFQHGPVSGWMDRLAGVLPHNGLIVNSHYTGKKQRQMENPVRFMVARNNPIEKVLLGTSIQEPKPDEVTSQKQRLINDYGITNNTVVISSLCRLVASKGPHILIEAAQILKENLDTKDFFITIWGDPHKSTEYQASLIKTITDHHLPVALKGSTNRPDIALASSQIVVNSSTTPEAFGLTVIEGMTLGVVPVVPNEGGPAEVVKNGEVGLQFTARDAHSLAKQLETLIKDTELRTKLATQAQDCAKTKFNSQRAVGQVEAYHQRIIDSF